MKRLFGCMLVGLCCFMACGKKNEAPRYAKNSKQYLFFKTISEKTSLFDPDLRRPLVETSAFTLTNRDLMPRIYSISRKAPSEWQSMSKEVLLNYARQMAAQEAETRLLVASAKSRGIRVSKDTVESRINAFFKQLGGKEAFNKYIDEYGLTTDLMRNNIRNTLVVQSLANEIIFKNIAVSDADVKAAYETEKYATIRQIGMKTSGKNPDEIAAIEKKMESLLARARGGENFSTLAGTYSEDESTRKKGGLNENLSKYSLFKSFSDAIFSLQAGGISDVLRTPDWFFIIKLVERTRETRPFGDVKEPLRMEMLQEKKHIRYAAYLDSVKKYYGYREIPIQNQ